MAKKAKDSKLTRAEEDFHKHNTQLKKGSIGIEAIHKVKNDVARSVTQLEELWTEWDGKIYVSVSAEKKRVWKKYHTFHVSYNEDKARERFWHVVRSSISNIMPKITQEELEDTEYAVSNYDGNVYRVDYNAKEGTFFLEYFLLDTIYKDEYRLMQNRKGEWELYLKKWMKFPIPIREFSFVAEQAKRIVNRQWKDIVRIIERGLREAL